MDQRKNPDYRKLIAEAEDAQKNKGYKKTLTATMNSAGIPLASKVLADMVTLYIAQLETSTFVQWQYESTMPIPIKNPEKLMFLRFTLFERGSKKGEVTNYLIRDVKIALVKNQTYDSSRLIDGVFEERKSILAEVDGQTFALTAEEILPIKHALVKLHERNIAWKALQKDVARQKLAADLLENYLGMQHTALPAPDPRADATAITGKVEEKESNPFDLMQKDITTASTRKQSEKPVIKEPIISEEDRVWDDEGFAIPLQTLRGASSSGKRPPSQYR